jgi:putative spermidine/putrescine transport system substrate-binding protein
VQWGANILLYNTKQLSPAPKSWAAIYDPKNKGKITVPDNAIQIADAALYLSKTKPSLGITDPYELTMPQLDAAVALLKGQKPLIKKYWALSSDVVDLFRNGDAVVAAAWPIAASTLEAAKFPAKEEIPAEGATGWADTWMLATKAKHPNCAYLWMKYIETPQVQAEQAVSYGETPANKLACPLMDKIQAGACHRLHADAPSGYFNSIKFWKTPISDCGNGKNNCTDYTVWLQRWQTVKG